MSEVIYAGKIDGQFYGFNDECLYKMKDGSYWIQAESGYWYHYAFCPDAVITLEKDTYILTVADNSIPIKKMINLIESQIDGEFSGWDGNSVYKLRNGQVWKQRSYLMDYKAASMPEVVVYETRSGYRMNVAGTTAEVSQEIE